MRALFQKLLAVVMVIGLTVSFSGCTALVAVGAGAVGGYAISRDTFEGITGKGQEEIWDAAHTVLSIMGIINEDNRKQGELHATVYGASVTVAVMAVNLTTTKLRVKARKNLFPRSGLAQEIYTKIINQLEQ